jgi:MoaA/NifB/PqqE/SkfB family radical SAM enzyme
MVRKDDLVDYDPETGVCRTTPRQVFLELTPRCNLACVHCSKDYGLPHPEDRDMSAATLDALLPWLLAAHSVNLNLVGEPLIAEQFDRALEICARGTAAVGFNTNGLGLSPAVCDRIVAARVDSVVVSIDGVESNQPVRGVPYRVLKERLLALHAAKVRARSALPRLGVAVTLMRRNLHELPRLLLDLLPAVPLAYVHLQPLIVFWETLRDQNPYLLPEVEDVVERARAIAQAHGASISAEPSSLGGLAIDVRFPRLA